MPIKTFSCDPSGWIEQNRQEYGERYGLLNWVSDPAARAAEGQRQDMLARLHDRVSYGFNDTKIDCRHLSPGCALCGQGLWSCLFINGRCNCRCFYCPTAQEEIGLPTTNTLTFPEPQPYLEYLQEFGFRGVSLSGGEPFLTFDLALEFVRAIKKRFAGGMYLWMYTNGTLTHADQFRQLRDAGLDEIRFDIGAVNNDLRFAKAALGIIPAVTVEIPAVPEDKETIKDRIREMAGMGIRHLNLHQMRLTPFNLDQFTRRGYTFLHGLRATVLESELTALELLLFTLDEDLPLPVNYCSFHYKNSFQHAGSRRRAAGRLRKSHEDITEKGYLRSLRLTAAPERIAQCARALTDQGHAPGTWTAAPEKGQLLFTAQCLPGLPPGAGDFSVTYFEAAMADRLSYRLPFVEVKLPGKSVFIERRPASEDVRLNAGDLALLTPGPAGDSDGPPAAARPFSGALIPFEDILPGWRPYC